MKLSAVQVGAERRHQALVVAAQLGFDLCVAGGNLPRARAEALLVVFDAYQEQRYLALPPGLYATPDGHGICDLTTTLRCSHRDNGYKTVRATAVPHLTGVGCRINEAYRDARARGWATAIAVRAYDAKAWAERFQHVLLDRLLQRDLSHGPPDDAHVSTMARWLRSAKGRLEAVLDARLGLVNRHFEQTEGMVPAVPRPLHGGWDR